MYANSLFIAALLALLCTAGAAAGDEAANGTEEIGRGGLGDGQEIVVTRTKITDAKELGILGARCKEADLVQAILHREGTQDIVLASRVWWSIPEIGPPNTAFLNCFEGKDQLLIACTNGPFLMMWRIRRLGRSVEDDLCVLLDWHVDARATQLGKEGVEVWARQIKDGRWALEVIDRRAFPKDGDKHYGTDFLQDKDGWKFTRVGERPLDKMR